jgi:uncharacterized protein (DUF488 family)
LIMNNPLLFTIGYTKRSAQNFFSSLKNSNVKLLIDIRLNNTSQLAGYTKKDDLAFFLKEICNCAYVHLPDFSPSKDILDSYHSKNIDWQIYESKFGELLETRNPISQIKSLNIDHACLLCAEPTPDKCHRRLVADYIKRYYPETAIQHL